jgi:hypothetical protein
MADMTTTERMLKLLPHWADHTAEHIEEIRRWRTQGKDVLDPAVLDHLEDAERIMADAREALNKASAALKANG